MKMTKIRKQIEILREIEMIDCRIETVTELATTNDLGKAAIERIELLEIEKSVLLEELEDL
jgi:hypothetical protein